MKQCSAWEKSGVRIIHRPLRYPRDWPITPAEEKGIDVALTIDVVTMAVDREYEVGVVLSTDTDISPALEYVLKRIPKVRMEVAAWHVSYNRALRVEGGHLWCHRLMKADYDRVADYTDYNLA